MWAPVDARIREDNFTRFRQLRGRAEVIAEPAAQPGLTLLRSASPQDPGWEIYGHGADWNLPGSTWGVFASAPYGSDTSRSAPTSETDVQPARPSVRSKSAITSWRT